MTRYARGATATALQSAACHGGIEEYAATILGVQRPAVTLIAGVLQRSGVIDYHGGIVTILNRRRLGDQRDASRDEDHAPPRPHIVARER